MTMLNSYCHLVVATLLFVVVVDCKPPNIIFILADDYGYNDVGYHGSLIKTPNIDKLARSGVILENYYVQPICTPSRSQLMTGRYQIRMGIQHSVFFACQPICLPLDEVLLPEKLQEAGYMTHIVGKWHLGFYKEQCLPTNRGFHTQYGYYNSKEDYYTKQQCGFVPGGKEVCGYDFHDNGVRDFDGNGTYSTYLYEKRVKKIIHEHDTKQPFFLYLPFQSVHSPEQAPTKYIQMYEHIKNISRRHHAAMVTAMDDSIGHIVDSLHGKGIFDETLIVFSTDNGGQTIFGGNNWPLRGRKASLWEGGIRGVGFIAGAGIKKPGRISTELMHISDWFPTLLHVAGGNLQNLTKKLDGFNVWDTISIDAPSPRTQILHNIDPIFTPMYMDHAPPLIPFPNKHGFNTSEGHASLRMGKWKLLTGFPGYTGRVPPPMFYDNNSTKYKLQKIAEGCDTEKPYPSLQLYNVVADPTESHEISKKFPIIVDEMLKILSQYNATAVPVFYPDDVAECDPALRGGVWGPWA